MAHVRGGPVGAHVQAFCDAVERATEASSFGTYNGHQPTRDQAVDIFTPVHSSSLGNAICAYALQHLEHFGIDYVIYRRRIYNPEVARHWRWMPDRGGPTANHDDHVHVSFVAMGSTVLPGGGPVLLGVEAPQWPGRYFQHPPGIQGDDVRQWQQRMAERGWHLAVDGAYGPGSRDICVKFQREKGLSADGIVGPATWSAAWTAPVT